MKRSNLASVLALAVLGGAVQFASAGANQLDDSELTAFGAQRGASADGRIPAYTGEPIGLPACYDKSEPRNLCDPWNDKPLYTITAQNLEQYAGSLTEGQKAMFARYPDFKMNVYPSRRTMRAPEYYLANSKKNVDSCKTTKEGTAIEGCYGGVPFPLPKTGNEVLWNHQLAYTPHLSANLRSYLVDGSGRRIMVNAQNNLTSNPFTDSTNTGPSQQSIEYFRVRNAVYEPARRNGELVMIRTNLAGEQRAWQYLPGQRRVKLAPDLSYDTPSPVAGGITTMDEQRLLLGRQDRYDFKYVGVQEKLINYNNFAVYDYKSCSEDKLFTKSFPNPECIRWELHRVRVVEATLKPGFRHLLPKRSFYLDEDASGLGIADSYDSAGKLIRIDTMLSIPDYVFGYGVIQDNTVTFDLERGAYTIPAFTAFKGGGYQVVDIPESVWSPENMAQVGIR
ncbi:DUF1329 domain-containing protein [Pseudomonas sp. NBRC 100443]|uniref:DUF1329 domain-containing protein n=1 Tax=Pseudomonas sp. NBRC 100443 TaxID=1113665 RepID=UPI0024A1CF4F|nr:DUF1329 domain-containing protein [Pseudomonas sp. NBRC 100443]GLU39224.1 hypothetical protein Pssp01_33170 [Pseudomonas sp. NBRC 100443]